MPEQDTNTHTDTTAKSLWWKQLVVYVCGLFLGSIIPIRFLAPFIAAFVAGAYTSSIPSYESYLERLSEATNVHLTEYIYLMIHWALLFTIGWVLYSRRLRTQGFRGFPPFIAGLFIGLSEMFILFVFAVSNFWLYFALH